MFIVGKDVEKGWLGNWLDVITKSGKENHYSNNSTTWPNSSTIFFILFSFVFGLISHVSLAQYQGVPELTTVNQEGEAWPQSWEELKLCPGFLSPSGWQSPSGFLLFRSFLLRQDLITQPRVPLTLRSSFLGHPRGWEFRPASPCLAGPFVQHQDWLPNAAKGCL